MMLERIDGLPAGVWGLRAKGTVSKDDYDLVVRPVLEQAGSEGRGIRFLYEFGPEFEGFTAPAAWEDLRVGLHYLRLFERCAVVTDVDWLRRASRAAAALMPCPVRVFGNAQWTDAVDGLSSPPETSLTYRILPDRGVLLVEPHAKLRAEDFDALAMTADSWIEAAGGSVDGLVVHARAFPGWENLGSMLRHLRFVRDHHRKIRRVALAVDGRIAEIAPVLVEHFVEAEIKRFGADEVDRALAWAGGEDGRTEGPPA